MPDLDPAVIESLLYAGAHRRDVTVDAYRDLVQAAAVNAGIAFEKALGVLNDFEMRDAAPRKARGHSRDFRLYRAGGSALWRAGREVRRDHARRPRGREIAFPILIVYG